MCGFHIISSDLNYVEKCAATRQMTGMKHYKIIIILYEYFGKRQGMEGNFGDVPLE